MIAQSKNKDAISSKQEMLARLQNSLKLYQDMKILGVPERREISSIKDHLDFIIWDCENKVLDAKIEALNKILEIMRKEK